MKPSTQITVKLLLIAGLTLLMLIPQLSMLNLTWERKGYKQESISKIATQWGNQQFLSGPILAIPYYEQKPDKTLERHEAYFLPETLSAHSNVDVSELEKSIYKIPVFTSENTLNVEFSPPSFDGWAILPENILWAEAKLILGVSDPKGIMDSPSIKMEGVNALFEPAQHADLLTNSAMDIQINEDKVRSGFKAEIFIKLNGTQSLHISPVGQTTSYTMSSNWPHPNFQGDNQGFTPIEREVTPEGFTASWSASKFNSALSYRWRDVSFNGRANGMGVKFHQMADHYTKSERSIKYMILIIGLIFLSFLLSELLHKMRIHPFQYILVGAAIVVFYILLLALSEYLGYNMAYLISGIATTTLITLYCSTVFKKRSMIFVECGLLIALFTFLFVIINAMQYSLIIGAIGVFFILALTMYFTRKINWYSEP